MTAHKDDAADLNALLVAVGKQDEEAFEQLYHLCSRKVHGLVRRVVRDEEMSAEVTQEVFLALWQRDGARFDPNRASAMSWILTISHRRAVDKVRSEQSRTIRDFTYGVQNYAPDSDVVINAVMNRLDALRVIYCLEGLSTLQDQAIRLAYYDGLTYQAVAHHLVIPVSTAKTRIRDGLRKLATCLAEDNPPSDPGTAV